MNTGFVLGARVPAQVTAAGMLMLALRDPQEVQDWLQAKTLKAYTSQAITSKERLSVECRSSNWSLTTAALPCPCWTATATWQVPECLHADGNESSEDAVARVLPVLQETARAMRNLI